MSPTRIGSCRESALSTRLVVARHRRRVSGGVRLDLGDHLRDLDPQRGQRTPRHLRGARVAAATPWDRHPPPGGPRSADRLHRFATSPPYLASAAPRTARALAA